LNPQSKFASRTAEIGPFPYFTLTADMTCRDDESSKGGKNLASFSDGGIVKTSIRAEFPQQRNGFQEAKTLQVIRALTVNAFAMSRQL
jgi:hypothetical protein